MSRQRIEDVMSQCHGTEAKEWTEKPSADGGYHWVHEKAVIHGGAAIGHNSVIGQYVTIAEAAVIGTNCCLKTSSSVGARSIIGNMVTFGDGAAIGADVTVGNYCRFESCRVKSGCKIAIGVLIKDRVVLNENVEIGSNAVINEDVIIGIGAVIGHDVVLFERSRIDDGAKFKNSPLVIVGSRHFVCHSGPRRMAIGCQIHTLEHWKKHIIEIGRNNSYDAKTIAEYKLYFALVQARDLAVFPPAKPKKKTKTAKRTAKVTVSIGANGEV